MMRKLLWGLGGLWMLILVILLLNSSRWAPPPSGKMQMIAHRGVHHIYDPTGVGRDDCTAIRMLPGQEDLEIFENTIHSIRAAVSAGADMVEVDVAPTSDGHMVLFHDWTVDCRTEGKGETRSLTLAQLQALDIGHGYSADGGATFPLRGKGVGKIPTVEQAIASETFKPFLFNFKNNDPAEADQLFAILRKAGRDPLAEGDGFYGAEVPVQRMRELMPGVWTWSKSGVKACTRDYAWMGWLGITPESCRDGTLVVPLDYQWLIAGWPNRTQARMDAVGAHILLIGPMNDRESTRGLTRGEQLTDIPASFAGHVMVEDIRKVGPALVR
ncbi:glycerophosphoryl diester phosphodiesterase [Parasphingorhabdus marina DSM 22363]|uniref:Glycerophosphoryl diester phosphodiesterase n=1 Tax=Parasphingorhabdus marina DSM 22363 TaxID=1123272 RepID=A0A1N6CSS9_9SPHN|nr:glycerophosphodiester phosphodiesterase family protein [Parasphingorhabdus marina]SIN61454.1 glycerophosphoryl diester phosphodiesterase [Parasphingorhabdus marina DSM 22363]